MTGPFTRTFVVRWSDADANGHLRNTAFSEFANDTRIGLFSAMGFDWGRFQSLQLGPVLFREEVEYLREAAIGETVLVDALLAGCAPDASRWSIRHRMWKPDGAEMARITVTGSFMDLSLRKLAPPPRDLAETLRSMRRSDPFAELPALRRRAAS